MTPYLSQPSTRALPSLRPVGFWSAFDSLSTGKALMVVWRSLLGSDFPSLQPFLQPTPEQSLTYPCMWMPWCECDHEVVEDPEWDHVAVCTCGGDCEPFPLTRQDTMLHAFNRRSFGEALRQALGFAAPLISHHQQSSFAQQPFQIGSYQPLHAPVYFYAPTSAVALSARVNAMLAGPAGPFLLLTPTATFITPQLLQSLNAADCAHAALSNVLKPSRLLPPGRASSPGAPTQSTINNGRPGSGQLSAVLTAWSAALTSRPGPALLEGLHREIAAVRHDFVELRTAKQRLEKMQAEGVFSFTQKVDATSFKILCTILAHGDAAKAGHTLGISDGMMRKLLGQWRTRGPAYQAMLDIVRWRKKVGRKETMPLNDAILHEKADTTDYPALLSDVLDGLLSMTDENWPDLAEDLAQMLRPVITAANRPGPNARTPVRGSYLNS